MDMAENRCSTTNCMVCKHLAALQNQDLNRFNQWCGFSWVPHQECGKRNGERIHYVWYGSQCPRFPDRSRNQPSTWTRTWLDPLPNQYPWALLKGGRGHFLSKKCGIPHKTYGESSCSLLIDAIKWIIPNYSILHFGTQIHDSFVNVLLFMLANHDSHACSHIVSSNIATIMGNMPMYQPFSDTHISDDLHLPAELLYLALQLSSLTIFQGEGDQKTRKPVFLHIVYIYNVCIGFYAL